MYVEKYSNSCASANHMHHVWCRVCLQPWQCSLLWLFCSTECTSCCDSHCISGNTDKCSLLLLSFCAVPARVTMWLLLHCTISQSANKCLLLLPFCDVPANVTISRSRNDCLLLLPFCNVPPSVTITLSAKAQINVCCHHFVMCQPVWVSHFAMCQPVSQSANKCLLLLLPFLWCASKCSYHTISRSTNNCLTLSAEAQTDVCCCYCVVMCQQVWL